MKEVGFQLMDILSPLRRVRGAERGFTLVELMVVIVILGIIIAIATPQFTGQVDKARKSAVLADLSSMKALVELHLAEKGRLPGASEIGDVMRAGGINWGGDLRNPWNQSYTCAVNQADGRYIVYTRNGEDSGDFYYVTDLHVPTGPAEAVDGYYIGLIQP